MSTATTSSLPDNAVWFVTGCSSGIGAEICKYALDRGQRVVATARKPESLNSLPDTSNVLKLALDVTVKGSVDEAFKAALAKFGRLDVVVNNAGFGMMGPLEAFEEKSMRGLMETNFWGALNVTREAMRVFREVNVKNGRIGGVVVQVSSMGGRVAFPGSSLYHASKYALEGLTESLAAELSPDWNIKFLILEPGGTKTEYARGGMVMAPAHPAYAGEEMPINQLMRYVADPKSSEQWAEPKEVAKLLFEVVGRADMPLRLVTGGDTWGFVHAAETAKMEELQKWKDVSFSCGGSANLDGGK